MKLKPVQHKYCSIVHGLYVQSEIEIQAKLKCLTTTSWGKLQYKAMQHNWFQISHMKSVRQKTLMQQISQFTKKSGIIMNKS